MTSVPTGSTHALSLPHSPTVGASARAGIGALLEPTAHSFIGAVYAPLTKRLRSADSTNIFRRAFQCQVTNGDLTYVQVEFCRNGGGSLIIAGSLSCLRRDRSMNSLDRSRRGAGETESTHLIVARSTNFRSSFRRGSCATHNLGRELQHGRCKRAHQLLLRIIQ
jgi:hypothetical protein